MIFRCVFWSIFLCLVLGSTVESQVTVNDQGYHNVLISFAPNVPSEKGKELVLSIQDLLKSASGVLQKAVGIRIASVTFLLPPSWTTEQWGDITVTPASSKQTERRPDISVHDAYQNPFGKQPVTLQYGGCGVPGYQIILPLDFVSSTQKYPKGKLLAREWLKYRYGVFDENGFPNDVFYPDYYRVSGGSEIRITECTNSKVDYRFKTPINRDPCNMDSDGYFGYCRAYPDGKSTANLTSSLMYYHKELPDMEHVCGKDGHPHNTLAKNKHNALCNGRSIWEVVKSSDDFITSRNQSSDLDTEPIQFPYIQENKPRIVILLENSYNFLEKELPSALRFALRRFYYDLPPKSKLAIYTYNSDVSEALPFNELPAEGRSDLQTIANFRLEPTNICTSCGLAKATQILLENSEVEKSSILLITASDLDKVPEFPEKLKESEICLNVLRFSKDDHPVDPSYNALAESFPCFSQESLLISLDVEGTLNALARFLKNSVQQFRNDLKFKTVVSKEMSFENPVTIPEDETADLYTLWIGRTVFSSSIDCKVNGTSIGIRTRRLATDIASFTFYPKYGDITCKFEKAEQPAALTQVQMTTRNVEEFVYDAWIHDLSTEKEQRPILIYAKIHFRGFPVKEAKVTVTVSSENNQEEIVIMLDNGLGDPDVTQYDGIYSGYFTNFSAAGKYMISVKIDDNGGDAKIGKEIPTYSFLQAPCCGRKVVSEDHDVPAFKVEKHIGYVAVNKRPEDGYPPSRILDLRVLVFPNSKQVFLAWSTPGGGKAERYNLKLFRSREDAIQKFDTTGRELNASGIVPGDIGKTAAVFIPFEELDENVPYYATVRSWNEFDKPSEISMVAEFIVPKPVQKTTPEESSSSSTPGSTTDGGIGKQDPPPNSNKTIGIVFGVLGGIAVLCILVFLGYYFFVKKPRRN